MRKLSMLNKVELDVLYEALIYFATNCDYHKECEELQHLTDDEIDEITIKIREIISHEQRKIELQKKESYF